MNNSLLNRILATQSESFYTGEMERVILRLAREFGATNVEVDEGNIYITKGRSKVYPCVVAHTDTVHAIVSQKEYRVRYAKGQYFAFNHPKGQLTGIGGDDKVGIYVALRVLELFPVCKVAFFRDEEVGCLGSYEAEMSFFDDCAFVLQCDRNGSQDFVKEIGSLQLYGTAFSKAVRPHLRKHGYREWYGAMTDVEALKTKGLPVAAANMSCGYYNPHTAHEYVKANDVRRCENLVFDVVRDMGKERWEHQYERVKAPVVYQSGWSDSWRDESWRETALDKRYRTLTGARSVTTNRNRTLVPYGNGNLIETEEGHVLGEDEYFGDYRVLQDGSLEAAKGGRGSNPNFQEEWQEEETFQNPKGIVCPWCNSQSQIDYDDHVGYYFCHACTEYIFITANDDEETIAAILSGESAREQNLEAVPF